MDGFVVPCSWWPGSLQSTSTDLDEDLYLTEVEQHLFKIEQQKVKRGKDHPSMDENKDIIVNYTFCLFKPQRYLIYSLSND